MIKITFLTNTTIKENCSVVDISWLFSNIFFIDCNV